MTQLVILQANFLKSNKYPEHDHQLLLSQGADLVGVNEGNPFRHLFLNSPGYQVAMPKTRGARTNNPIFVSNRLTFLGFAAYDMCRRVGQSPPRAATVAKYLLDGKRRAHIVTHTNAHIELAGRPRNLPRVFQDTVHMVRLGRMVRRLKKQGYKVTVAGDFNWAYARGNRGWYFAPKRVFNRLGLAVQWADRTAPKGGSLGSRQIDYIAYDPHDLRIVKQGFVAGEHSDHRWPIVTFEVR
jgi:hypothetical protein